MNRAACRDLRPGDLILVSNEHWAAVLTVPFGFPWIASTVTIDTGWPIHRDHITEIERQPASRKATI